MIEDDELRRLKESDHRKYVDTQFVNATQSVLDGDSFVPSEKDPFINGMRMKENVDHDPKEKTIAELLREARKRRMEKQAQKDKEEELLKDEEQSRYPESLFHAVELVLLTEKREW